jgi:DNA-binding response OmpR family regulator
MQPVHDKHGTMGARVVLAEDDPELRTLYAERLRGAGHVVWEAADGGQAFDLVRTQAPDLLLLDMWMPVLNALEVLQQLGGCPEAVGLKTVVLSPLQDADTHLEGYALGVDDYWIKDSSVGDLLEQIERLMRADESSPRQTG